ncbi:MAG TPA: YCF48-related protein [Pyrinomonadaceae bacterium]|nr:YCF48-related protein [Pyrinomonadaceae bacterium]
MSFFQKSSIIFALIFCFSISTFAQSVWSSSKVKSNGDLITVYFTSSEKGWIAGDNGYLAFTNDSGRNWTKKELGTNEDINEIYFRNDDNGYLVAGKKMFITKDGGNSWRETRIYKLNDFPSGQPEFLSIRFANKKRGIVIGSILDRKGENVIDSLVMRTEDGGETWVRVLVPSKLELYHLDFVGDNYCWIVGDGGLILASTDGGGSFVKQKSGTDKDLYNVDFRDEKEGYAVGSKGTILRTEDGGNFWRSVRTSYQSTFMRVDFADDKNGWIVGYDGTILRSNDKGKNWTKQESKITDRLYGLYMTKKYGYAVGGNGMILQYQK